jgi:hypothetical protein
MITNRNLSPGTRLVAKYRGQDHHALILDAGDVFLQREIEDTTPIADRTYKSLSKAANAITGNSVNGWRFWSIAEIQPPTDEEEEAWQLGPNDAPGLEDEPRTCAFCGAQMAEGDDPNECSHAEGQGGAAGTIGNEPAPKLLRNIKRTANQLGIPASEVRFFCRACCKSFLSPENGTGPEACPEGHPVMMPV